jgi:flavin reductase (DIM6/NTAB) family NADH-FMN oxidoreductase RutF
MDMLVDKSPAGLLQEYKRAMRRCAKTVAVVAVGERGSRHGFTATSYCSLSLSPPTIMICVDRQTRAYGGIVRNRRFSMNYLRPGHDFIADTFAGKARTHGEERFDDALWEQSPLLVPVLRESAASLICGVEETIERVSHSVFIAEIIDVYLGSTGASLVYANGSYQPLVCD